VQVSNLPIIFRRLNHIVYCWASFLCWLAGAIFSGAVARRTVLRLLSHEKGEGERGSRPGAVEGTP
jgi:hypothetical protein